MIESAFHRWGLIVLLGATVAFAGFGDGAWRWGALAVGAPAVIVFHSAMTLTTRRRARREGDAQP